MAPKATVIILAWNRWDLTRRCLDSLGATDLTDAEVLVVDNGSTDRTVEVARQGGARVVSEPERGYGAACLRGLAELGPHDVIVFLRPPWGASRRAHLGFRLPPGSSPCTRTPRSKHLGAGSVRSLYNAANLGGGTRLLV